MKHTFGHLPSIISASKTKLTALKGNFPSLRCYLVFSSNLGQCPLKAEPEILEEFPEIVEASADLDSYLNLRKKLSKARKHNLPGEIEKIKRDLESIHPKVMKFPIRDNVFVELRFEQLNFELIETLKNDPLLDNPYNEKASRSIRIVLMKVQDVV